MRKEKGVSIKVSEDFYRTMERMRLKLNNKYNIKVSSHIKLTKMLAKNKKMFENKDWIRRMKKCYGY